MVQLKQRTVEGYTITLHKLENPMRDLRNTPYLYEIRINGTTDEERFTRDEADRAFSKTVDYHKTDTEQQNQQQDHGMGGMFGMDVDHGFGGMGGFDSGEWEDPLDDDLF